MMPFLQANGSTLGIAALGCLAIYLLLGGNGKSAGGNGKSAGGIGGIVQRLLPRRDTVAASGAEPTVFGGEEKTVDERDLAALDQLRARATRRKSKKLEDAVHGIEAVYFDEGETQGA